MASPRLPHHPQRRAALGVGALVCTGLVGGGLIVGQSSADAAQVCLDPWKIVCWDDGQPTTSSTITKTTARQDGPTTTLVKTTARQDGPTTTLVKTTARQDSTTTTAPSTTPLPVPSAAPATLPGSTVVRFDRNLDGTAITTDRYLGATDYVGQGILRITGVNEGNYCGGSVAALNTGNEPVGGQTQPLGYLTSARADDMNMCNGKPLELYLKDPARSVAVEFTGAVVPYALTAYDANGTQVARVVGTPETYGSPRMKIRVDSAGANIQSFTFGSTAALTQIRTVELTR